MLTEKERFKPKEPPLVVTQEVIDHWCKTPFDEAFIIVAKRRGDIIVKEASS